MATEERIDDDGRPFFFLDDEEDNVGDGKGDGVCDGGGVARCSRPGGGR